MIDSSWHPDDNECALFLEGALDDVTTNEITRHLATCNDCLEIVGGSAKSLGERAWWQQPTLWKVAAAIVIAVVGLALFWQWRGTSGIDAIVAAAPRDHRVIAPRLTGFAFAPAPVILRGGPADNETEDSERLRFEEAAYKAIERAEKSSSADAAHTVGIGYIVVHDNKNAIASLTKATQRDPNDAHVRNDLGAAQLADRQNAAALASIDRAIRLDPHLAEAWFNRALILEQLDRSKALDAWRAYLKLDPNSGWAGEARDHIDRLTAIP